MMSRLSRRSVLVALTCDTPCGSGGACRSSCSGGPDDVDHEVQRVGALDARLGVAGLAVAVGRRDRDEDLAADALTGERLHPAGDDSPGAGDEPEARGVRAAEVLV